MKEAPSKFETAPSRESRLEHVAFTMTIAVTGHQDLKVYLLNWPIEHATETWFRGLRMKDMTMLRVEIVGGVHGQLDDNHTCEESRSKVSKCPIILIHLSCLECHQQVLAILPLCHRQRR